jgi:uncharacterized protein with HEPN domain
MQPDERDAAQLWVMVKWGEYLIRRSAEITLDDLLRDEDQQLMVSKATELLGEAARRVSKPFRAAHPEIAWPEITGMRSVLVHEYERVEWPLVWDTITQSVPALLQQLRPLLPDLPPDEPL